MRSYHAPNPYENNSITGLYFIDSFLQGVASIPNVLFGSSSSSLILPAQNRKLESKFAAEEKEYKEYNLKKINIITHDNAELDSIEVTSKLDKELLPSNKIYIIKFNGNGALYEYQVDSYIRDTKKLKCSVVGFNYRGVGESKGDPMSKSSLVIDGIAEVQRILDKGILPKNIVLDGVSLGGAVATLVAKHFHGKGFKINLFNDRSFSSISSTAVNMILREDSVISRSCKSCASSTLFVSDWEMNAAAAYKTIPAAHKGYMFVIEKNKAYPQNQGDGVIPHKSSLHVAVAKTEGQGDKVWPMLTSSACFFGGHNAHRVNLISKDNPEKTGQDVFEEFVLRVTR